MNLIDQLERTKRFIFPALINNHHRLRPDAQRQRGDEQGPHNPGKQCAPLRRILAAKATLLPAKRYDAADLDLKEPTLGE